MPRSLAMARAVVAAYSHRRSNRNGREALFLCQELGCQSLLMIAINIRGVIIFRIVSVILRRYWIAHARMHLVQGIEGGKAP